MRRWRRGGARPPRFAVATISACGRLPEARVIARSLRRWNPDVPCFVLLADEPDAQVASADDPLRMLVAAELGIPGFRDMAFRCEREPLSYALTPHLLAHLLRNEGLEAVVFIKQQSMVVGDLAPIVEPLASSPVVLTPHLLNPLGGPDAVARELAISRAGIFNGGVVGVAAGDQGLAFLDWWADRIGDRCVLDAAAGLHYEQRWLDHAPALFDGVRVLRDPGANLGHWNMRERTVEVAGRAVFVDGHPASVARFSGYEPERPDRATKYVDGLPVSDIGGATALFDTYRAELVAAGHDAAAAAPYAYGRFADGVAIPPLARALHQELGAEAGAFGDPFAVGRGTFREWLAASARADGTPAISRVWDAVWRSRVDLQAAFPDHLGDDGPAFAGWRDAHGRREHEVPDEL